MASFTSRPGGCPQFCQDGCKDVDSAFFRGNPYVNKVSMTFLHVLFRLILLYLGNIPRP